MLKMSFGLHMTQFLGPLILDIHTQGSICGDKIKCK